MIRELYIGVDGGGSKSTIRIENEQGELLYSGSAGPSNIRTATHQAWLTITGLINHSLQKLAFQQDEIILHVGMGLAGCEVKESLNLFTSYPHQFKNLIVVSDAHTACLGAHEGHPGSIIIAGTGVVGYQINDQASLRLGGWGFPHDDDGSGAWIGLQALKLTLNGLDGRKPIGVVARHIFAHFNEDIDRLMAWANVASATQYAQLAPYIISASHHGDQESIQILQEAALAIDVIAKQLIQSTPLPIAFIGGVSKALTPYLDQSVIPFLREPKFPPEKGAIEMLKHQQGHSYAMHTPRLSHSF